jgi:predicted branched-subunit amino acid permease
MADPPPSCPGTATTGTDAGAFLFGVRTAFRSVFAFVIIFTYIGFGALCHDYGLSVGWGMLSTALQWAGPAQVILVTGLGPGTVLIETAVAVALSSVRFLPIVVSILPLVRREDTKPWQLLVPVHFMAISVWVEAMRHAPGLPREHRIPFCNGIGATLLGLGVVFTAVGYYMQSLLPAMFGAAAMFITPISFLTSAARNARALLDKAALALGIVIGPVLALNHVPFDLLWTGIVAGTLAYGAHRVQRTRAAKTDAKP